MKLQNITIGNKKGELHKIAGKYQYRSFSGKTIREYSTIEDLIKGETNGKQTRKAKKAKAIMVEKTTEKE
jgi:hypothetical protein